MFFKTGSLWSCWIAHTVTNTTLNLLHIVTEGGLDIGMPIRMTGYSVVALFGLLLVPPLARRFRLLEVQPWNRRPAGQRESAVAA
jgi:hypothetical protein